ncbi:hypothetical protein U6A24_20390 [Aquimarina gracilis]|uniref:Uncharacterized protein n=1 Tax=Aquimarina gracilis TaxID=874422 RepID=A0ABU6A110_9FLAO|nr:hypothetical protein [Aquimarina gracilis]MEB3347848.1 hypothetical protein [Aquimarina gracilis]
MKTLKILFIILLILTILFASLSFFTLDVFGNGGNSSGGDYLGGFWILVIFFGSFLVFIVGSISIGTIVFLPNSSNIIRFLTAAFLSTLTVYFVLVFTFFPNICFW